MSVEVSNPNSPPTVEALSGKTRSEIITTTPNVPTIALATDTAELLLWDSPNWQVLPLKVDIITANPDMGNYNDNSLQGYYSDTITDKVLSNIVLKDSARTDNGGLRVDFTQNPITLQLYCDGQWNNLVPFDFEPPLTHDANNIEYEVATGNSTILDIDGNPLYRRYSASMGAYAPSVYLSGGAL